MDEAVQCLKTFYWCNSFCDLSYHIIAANGDGHNFLGCFIVKKQQRANDNIDSKDSVAQE